ncbi:hypothetical protein PVL29_002863 [Vitis rotundifolia]|uniref:Uncharacterized protein n=1 Tax=Vitis rotundifolia TaxID=103349 RepID=A0AA39E017_VITRO|nr:hypothetical protein PVL29_002863 [Vitis rotundifolia]
MEMGLRAAEGKGSQKKELRLWRATGQKGVKGSLLEAIAQVNGGSHVVSHSDEDGVLRMKIVVKKQDLKQMLEVMRGGKSSAHSPLFLPSPSLSSEQRLNLLRRKHVFRGNQSNRSRRSSWRPALHSIPEEL